MMTEHQKKNRIRYLTEYATGWEHKYNQKAPVEIYNELESLQNNLPVEVKTDPLIQEVTSKIIDLWNDRELTSPESVDETAYWYFENLKTKTLDHIYDLSSSNG